MHRFRIIQLRHIIPLGIAYADVILLLVGINFFDSQSVLNRIVNRGNERRIGVGAGDQKRPVAVIMDNIVALVLEVQNCVVETLPLQVVPGALILFEERPKMRFNARHKTCGSLRITACK